VAEETQLEWPTAERGPDDAAQRVAASCRVALDPKRQIRRRRAASHLRVGHEKRDRVAEPVGGAQNPCQLDRKHLIATARGPRRARSHDQNAHIYSVPCAIGTAQPPCARRRTGPSR
jgi:hypothetical protein